jgi:hypothetical protein
MIIIKLFILRRITMTEPKPLSRLSAPILITLLLLTVAVAFIVIRQAGYAQAAPQIAGPDSAEPLPAFVASDPAWANPAALSPNFSYYFISGNTFTPDLAVSYARQVTGCVNGVPTGVAFSAPVHLPQGSQVVSITLYTHNPDSTEGTSTAYFIVGDAKSFPAWYLSASSLPSIIGFQQNDSTENNPAVIDNQNDNYIIQWRTVGVSSPHLGLCGVRVAYHAPLGAIYLPSVSR